MKVTPLLLCLIFLTITSCRAHDNHGHYHEDEEAMVRAGKEKWYKKPSADEDTGTHDHGHHHGHDHGHNHGHDHGHDHGHGHGHDHKHGHDHGHGHGHDHGHGHGHGHHHGPGGCSHSHTSFKSTQAQPKTPTKTAKKARTLTETVDVWWQAVSATVFISAVPFFILFFLPLESNAKEYQPLLKILLGFASGGLLGDAFLHLIPHSIHPHSHAEHDHDHAHGHGHNHSEEHNHMGTTIVGLWVLAGIVIFLTIEKFVRHAKGGHHHHHHHSGQEDDDKKEGHDSKKDDLPTTKSSDESSEDTEEMSQTKDESSEDKIEQSVRKRKKSDTLEKLDASEVVEGSKSIPDAKPVESEGKMQVSGYLNLAADFAHNFTDGLAIGASFLGGRTLGIVTTLTILLHEVPHEIGDFAILVQSGCKKNKAMYFQLFTATGALAGCILGLLTEQMGIANSCFLPLTAGGFIYIATVTVIPELLDNANAKPEQSVKEILAMFAGIAMMVLITFLEH